MRNQMKTPPHNYVTVQSKALFWSIKSHTFSGGKYPGTCFTVLWMRETMYEKANYIINIHPWVTTDQQTWKGEMRKLLHTQLSL